MQMVKNIFSLSLVFAVAALLYWFSLDKKQDVQLVPQEIVSEQAALVSDEPTYPHLIKPGATFASALRSLDVSAQDIHNVVLAAQQHKDLGRLKSGTRFELYFSGEDGPEFSGVRIKFSAQESLHIYKNKGEWISDKIVKPVVTRIVTFKGKVQNSLWESAVEAKMNPTLIAELAEIFAWQVDFSREVRPGDQWRLSVEEELVQGEHIGWGSILSAEYINNNTPHTAVLFRKNEEDVGYYAPDGSSLKRVFLKSPIQYGRISSRFQKKRFHPVLKINRPHLGVDYAAPVGTPIRAVGDGVISSIGMKGAGGNVIVLRHNSTYTTAYKHLSRFAKGMRQGVKVQQGQTIGYVGTTGLSSGPHLHYEFFVNGKFVDPLGQKFPTAEPISPNNLADFSDNKSRFLAYLPNWEWSEKVAHE